MLKHTWKKLGARGKPKQNGLDKYYKGLRIRSLCEKRTYTVEEVAMLLGISRTSAYEFVKKGEVKFVKIGASIRISKKSFDEWLDQQNI